MVSWIDNLHWRLLLFYEKFRWKKKWRKQAKEVYDYPVSYVDLIKSKLSYEFTKNHGITEIENKSYSCSKIAR